MNDDKVSKCCNSTYDDTQYFDGHKPICDTCHKECDLVDKPHEVSPVCGKCGGKGELSINGHTWKKGLGIEVIPCPSCQNPSSPKEINKVKCAACDGTGETSGYACVTCDGLGYFEIKQNPSSPKEQKEAKNESEVREKTFNELLWDIYTENIGKNFEYVVPIITGLVRKREQSAYERGVREERERIIDKVHIAAKLTGPEFRELERYLEEK